MPIPVNTTLFGSPVVLAEDLTSALKRLRKSRALYLRNANQKLADMHEEGKGKEGKNASKGVQPNALSSMANLYAGNLHGAAVVYVVCVLMINVPHLPTGKSNWAMMKAKMGGGKKSTPGKRGAAAAPNGKPKKKQKHR
jgi:hypothetical protein